MVSTYTTLPTAGVDTKRTSSRAEFKLGTVVVGDENSYWAYGQASGAIGAGVCVYTAATSLITTGAGAHTAPVAIADGDYAWVRQTAAITGS